MHYDYYIVVTTVSEETDAVNISKQVIDERLARCVNIIRNIRSIYSWQGETCDESEHLLLIKTGHPKLDELMEKLRSIHPYELPEIIAVPISTGDEDYLRWIWDWISAEF
jgi:periplasmic divalent cation tolerance protein